MILDNVDAQRLEMGMKTLQPKEEANNGKTTETKVASETKMDIAAEPLAKSMTKTEEKAELAKETAAVFKDLKEKRPDALLLMRKGDFYEAFDEDAKKVARSTGLKEQHIIKEGFEPKEGKGDEKGISYVNFKNTSLDKYLPKLVRNGHRVAICDSLEDIAKQRISERKETQTKANELQQPTEQKAKTIPLDQFNKLETEDGKKIDHFAVFKMKSGNYGVRVMVDGQQMSVKALDKEDRNAFFEHTTTKAALVQKYYGKELSQPKQEQRSTFQSKSRIINSERYV